MASVATSSSAAHLSRPPPSSSLSSRSSCSYAFPLRSHPARARRVTSSASKHHGPSLVNISSFGFNINRRPLAQVVLTVDGSSAATDVPSPFQKHVPSPFQKLMAALSVGASLLMVNPALAVGENDSLIASLLSWTAIAFVYFIVIPLALFYYLEQRWYKRKLFEAFLQFGLVFLFFPGMLLLAPFINMRKLPQNGAKEPWDDVRPY